MSNSIAYTTEKKHPHTEQLHITQECGGYWFEHKGKRFGKYETEAAAAEAWLIATGKRKKVCENGNCED